jgi:hypothetical protein
MHAGGGAGGAKPPEAKSPNVKYFFRGLNSRKEKIIYSNDFYSQVVIVNAPTEFSVKN